MNAKPKTHEGKKFILIWVGIFIFLVTLSSSMMFFVNITEEKELLNQMKSKQEREYYKQKARRRLAERKQNILQTDMVNNNR